jgi:peptidoglycan/xylan/chitin deacetylase (PgdA/CDA1 family)
MTQAKKVKFLCFIFVVALSFLRIHQAEGGDPLRIPILVYHRFGPVVADSMTVTTPVFAAHLRYLQDNAYTVIPLRQLVAYYLGAAPQPPLRSVVITVDDAHLSVYSQMLPLVQR